MADKEKILRFIPSLIWMIIIFYFSSRQTTGVQGTFTQRFLILKSLHLVEYAILFILFYFGFKKIKPSLFTAYLYALSDEFHQMFVPGREGRVRDTFIDLLGIFIGIFLIRYIFPIITKLNRNKYHKK